MHSGATCKDTCGHVRFKSAQLSAPFLDGGQDAQRERDGTARFRFGGLAKKMGISKKNQLNH